ncbi:MAG: pyruvate dehydrogenase complex dihydrolipoamide acetyltransferase [Sphingobacteriales bacterium]|jgi:pyruvate dehydrogenase E2 component (dihydrolipoamide acetyltransferase)|nr:pyruvate dehydrogenase complex dihydrolipoamide acetyltransferase [Sphingobacteriales bacterium]
MAEVVRMPKMSDTMTEGVLAKWHKKVGDKVKSGDLVAEVETDKATMDFESFQEGTILYIGVEEGKAVPVDGIIAVLGKEGEDYASLLTDAPAESTTAPVAVVEAALVVATPAAVSAPVVNTSSDARVKASPLAKKIAEDKGIDLSQVKGSAENGRIIKKDVEDFKAGAAPAAKSTTVNIPAFIGQEKYTEVPVSQMRKVIAKRLAESKFTAPHFYLKMTIDMSAAMDARVKMNEVAQIKISFNDIVLKAVAVALKQHPNVNSSWLGDRIRYNEHVNIGVAVAVEDGLLVPVVRFADGKSLSHISAEVKDFAQKAKDKKLQPSDWEGSTFTISNLGMFGIDEFTAIINPPDACILAVGGIQSVPVVKNGQVVPGNIMKLTLSCDHRVVDGATGAAFLQTVKSLLEEPVRLLV